MKEQEIRNIDVLNKYLELVKEDVHSLFDFSSFLSINCPACKSAKSIYEFTKIGFKYVRCGNCSTVFVNPRPSLEMLKEFYSKSNSTNFWVNDFFKPVARARRKNIFMPRAEYFNSRLKAKEGCVIGDIGAGFGLFLEELRKIAPNNNYVAIEPSIEMSSICLEKGFKTTPLCFEDIDERETFDYLTAFELLEHLADTESFLKKAYSLLKPNGYLLMTTLNIFGFDILLLWDKSKSIAPPHHLNFFNPSSITRLLNDVGFKVIEISTPGQLDWDIVEGMIKRESIDLGRFWNLLASDGSTESKKELQDWIWRNNFSSHMRILAKKVL